MFLNPVQTMVMIFAVAFATMLTRFLPFVLFPDSKEPPKVVSYLGKMLPPAMMGLLTVYCLRGVSLFQGSHALPEALAIGVIILLHKWKGNVLLSIGVGSLLYMALVQGIFS